MTVSPLSGLQAYQNAAAQFEKAQKQFQQQNSAITGSTTAPANSFMDTLNSSIREVNNMQGEKAAMITSFASGENQNVHELMITMQKAGLAINLTSAVRNKVLEAYRELSRLQF